MLTSIPWVPAKHLDNDTTVLQHKQAPMLWRKKPLSESLLSSLSQSQLFSPTNGSGAEWCHKHASDVNWGQVTDNVTDGATQAECHFTAKLCQPFSAKLNQLDKLPQIHFILGDRSTKLTRSCQMCIFLDRNRNLLLSQLIDSSGCVCAECSPAWVRSDSLYCSQRGQRAIRSHSAAVCQRCLRGTAQGAAPTIAGHLSEQPPQQTHAVWHALPVFPGVHLQ